MSDRYASFAHSGPGRALVKRLGLPDPPRLRRLPPGDPLVTGPVLLGGAPGGRLATRSRKMLTAPGSSADPTGASRATGTRTGVRRHRHHRLRPGCARSTTSSTRRPGRCAPAAG